MDFLDRDQYNRKISKLNTDSNVQDSDLEELTTLYDNLFCKLSDYEEIVMLINICIAEDRKNNLEVLYDRYSKVKKMIDIHGDYGIEDYDSILYCMGVFSFKFHDYKAAIGYFSKCEEQILNKFSDPYQSGIYVKVKILMSYSMEYEGYLKEGPERAINIILDKPLVMTEELEQQITLVIKDNPDELVLKFFNWYPSRIYSSADEPMKKEILHVLAHCFSEHAKYLKLNANRCSNYKTIYLWEKIAESFIDALGAEMITCKAIITSEHGKYWSALDNMKKQYFALNENERKKKAELAFYIYYFSNQIGMDQEDEIRKCKQYFLDFAEQENGDTKVYAWIVVFREKLAEALQNKGVKRLWALLEMEGFIKEGEKQSANQSYLHPQILREKNRLLLAYQILRSYLALNENNSITDFDNSLFEKCILFSKQNTMEESITDKEINWNVQEHLIKLHNIYLCVVGLTEEVHAKLEKDFCIKIPVFSDDSSVHDHKVFICNSDKQLVALNKMEKSHLILFIYCPDKYSSEIKQMIDENVCVENDIMKTFQIAYIQEILEKCYQFAYKWDEFYIMAPITDNSTFAFQNQGIEKFIQIKNFTLVEKEIFSETKGYATNEFDILTRVQEIDYIFTIKEERDITRILYFSEDCLYLYEKEKRCFVPYKVLRDINGIKKVVCKLHKHAMRYNVTKRKCDCQLKTTHCLCDEWPVNNVNIHELFMRFSVNIPWGDEKYCTLVWSSSTDTTNYLESFLLILSKQKIKSYSLREHLHNLSNIPQKIEYSKEDTADKKKDIDISPLRELLGEIEAYANKNVDYWPSESADYKQMSSLCEKIKNAINQKDIKEYSAFCSEWRQIREGTFI